MSQLQRIPLINVAQWLCCDHLLEEGRANLVVSADQVVRLMYHRKRIASDPMLIFEV